MKRSEPEASSRRRSSAELVRAGFMTQAGRRGPDHRSRYPVLVLAVGCLLVALACGGSPGGRAGAGQGTAAQPGGTPETQAAHWIPGLFASDVRDLVQRRGLSCQGPRQERKTNVWVCDGRTPLVTYHVELYGSAPGRIEYLTATVEQVQPNDEHAATFLGAVASIKYQGAEPVKAKEWVEKTMAAGGETMVGPASYKLRGEPRRRTLDIKAPGSEW
jgi:hypothetical protein